MTWCVAACLPTAAASHGVAIPPTFQPRLLAHCSGAAVGGQPRDGRHATSLPIGTPSHLPARAPPRPQAIGLPALAFLAYLAWTGKASLRKLRRSRSRIMGTYYGFVWGVTALNLLRSVVQIAQAGSGPPPVLWNVLWLATRFGGCGQGG